MNSDQQYELRAKLRIELNNDPPLDDYITYNDLLDFQVGRIMQLIHQHTAEVEAGARLDELEKVRGKYPYERMRYMSRRIAQLSPKKGEE